MSTDMCYGELKHVVGLFVSVEVLWPSKSS